MHHTANDFRNTLTDETPDGDDLDAISNALDWHGITADDHIVYVCTLCHQMGTAPDAASAAHHIATLDVTCCPSYTYEFVGQS